MSYLEEPLAGFLESVASADPAPGGGAVVAVAVALAAGLSVMSARLSAGYLDDADELVELAERLRQRAAPLAQEDARVYGRVLDAYRVPDDGDPEARRDGIGRRWRVQPTCRLTSPRPVPRSPRSRPAWLGRETRT